MEENSLKKREISQKIQNYIEDKISALTKKAGIYCRIFSRVKETPSIKKKMSKKNYTTHHKMQDILGVRIIFYFNEDVEIFKQYLKYSNHFIYDSESLSTSDIEKAESILRGDKWSLQDKLFMPTRLNVVFRVDEALRLMYHELFEELKNEEVTTDFIDETFEIQFRTVLSEGWHEVEHDLRYKCQDDWGGMTEESRMLNGIYATLETSEQAMSMLFNRMARKYYNQKNWEAMLRNVVRLHMKGSRISSEIRKCFELPFNPIRKSVLYVNREILIRALLSNDKDIELTMDNMILLINQLTKPKNRSTILSKYTQDNESDIYLINGESVNAQLVKEELGNLADKNIQVESTQTPIGTPITIISLKNNIEMVPVETLLETYSEHVRKNEIVVINLNEIEAASEKLIKRYLASLFIANGMSPINIVWDELKEMDSPKAAMFVDSLRRSIIARISKDNSKSGVVPNSVPKVKVDAVPYTSWYKVSFEDSMYM